MICSTACSTLSRNGGRRRAGVSAATAPLTPTTGRPFSCRQVQPSATTSPPAINAHNRCSDVVPSVTIRICASLCP